MTPSYAQFKDSMDSANNAGHNNMESRMKF